MADEIAVKLPSDNVLKRLSKLGHEAKAKSQALNGEYGSALKEAQDKHNLHIQAFKHVNKLSRMEPTRLAEFLLHEDAYREKLKLDDLAGQSMFDANGEASEEEDEAPKGASITPIGRAAGNA